MGVLKITRGRQPAPARVVIYGVEGIGKSTLAAAFPAPLVLDTEDGSRHLDCARVAIPDWQTLQLAVAELAVDRQGFETIVVDSIDWAERLLVEKVCRAAGRASVEDFGFGKGWVIVAEHLAKFLDGLDGLVAAGLNVVLVGHSTVKRVSPPELQDGYDRHELKLSKQATTLVKEWSDALLFATYKASVVEGNDGRKKAIGGRERVIHAERSAAFDAKNRFGLGPTLPMAIEALAPLFGPAPAPAPVKWALAAGRKRKAPPTVAEIEAAIRGATSVEALGRMGDRLDELAGAGDLTAQDREQLEAVIAARHDEIEPAAQEAAS
jgi:hypothetical protein